MLKLITTTNGTFHNIGIIVTTNNGEKYFPLAVVGKGGIDRKKAYYLWKLIAEQACLGEGYDPATVEGVEYKLETPADITMHSAGWEEVQTDDILIF